MPSKGRHIGAGVAELRGRLGPRDRRASAFPNRRLADAAVEEVIEQCSGQVRSWLEADGGADLALSLHTRLPAGIVVTAGAVHAGARVLVVLRRSRARSGYTVVAAYPLPARGDISGLERLAGFFGAYFHQDWAINDPPVASVVERFVKASAPAGLEQVASEIERLLVRNRAGAALRARLDELDLEYDPMADGQTTRSWLFDLCETLRRPMATAQAAAAAEASG